MKPLKHGCQCVAVIDDDSGFAESLIDLLGAAGIQARHFDSAEAFAGVLSDDEFDYLLVDWALPGMSGESLCRQIADRDDRARLLLMSGEHRCDELPTPLPSTVSFLDKPLDTDRLLQTLSAPTEL